jgi:hypothetical protein
MVNFKPPDNVLYFRNERELEMYYEVSVKPLIENFNTMTTLNEKMISNVDFIKEKGGIGKNLLNEQTFMGNYVWRHIVNITPYEDDIPWGFKDKIKNSEFDLDNNFNLESLLVTDPDFKEYFESGDERYGEDDDVGESELYNEIVVVDGELLDGYSRSATLLRRGKKTTTAFVAKTNLNEGQGDNVKVDRAFNYTQKFYKKNGMIPLAEPDIKEFAGSISIWQTIAYNDEDYEISFWFNYMLGKLYQVTIELFDTDFNLVKKIR